MLVPFVVLIVRGHWVCVFVSALGGGWVSCRLSLGVASWFACGTVLRCSGVVLLLICRAFLWGHGGAIPIFSLWAAV